jgi:hypothetical protein
LRLDTNVAGIRAVVSRIGFIDGDHIQMAILIQIRHRESVPTPDRNTADHFIVDDVFSAMRCRRHSPREPASESRRRWLPGRREPAMRRHVKWRRGRKRKQLHEINRVHGCILDHYTHGPDLALVCVEVSTLRIFSC